MGWLWNTTHDIFDETEGDFVEICICGLSAEQVTAGYNFIRSKTRGLRGNPTFYSYEAQDDLAIDEVLNAAEIVCKRQGKPFHFVSATTKIGRCNLSDLGFFIFEDLMTALILTNPQYIHLVLLGEKFKYYLCSKLSQKLGKMPRNLLLDCLAGLILNTVPDWRLLCKSWQ